MKQQKDEVNELKRTKYSKNSSPFKDKIIISSKKQYELSNKIKQVNTDSKNKAIENLKTKEIIFKMNTKKDDLFIYLPRDILQSLQSAALAIYPVLGCQSKIYNNDFFQISLENIADYAGITIPTTTKGIDYLEQKKLLNKKKVIVRTGHLYEYRVSIYRDKEIDKNKDNLFQFYHRIINWGIWKKLDYQTKQLYFIMRRLASFDYEMYATFEDLDVLLNGNELEEYYKENYANRKWDIICKSTKQELLELLKGESKLNFDNLNKSLKQLEKYNLIGRIKDEEGIYLVYLKPDNPFNDI